MPIFLLDSDSNEKALEAASAFVDETLSGVLKNIPGGKAGELKTFTDRETAIKDTWIVTECGKSRRIFPFVTLASNT